MDTSAEDDCKLLDLLRGHDRQAYAQIFKKYWSKLYDFALIKTNEATTAEEIVQELFVTLWEKRESLRITNLRSYLFTAVRNRVIDHYRYTVHLPLDSIPEIAATDYPVFIGEMEAAIQQAIDQLPPKTRQIYILKRMEDKTTREISEQLGTPERTVEHHYSQAIRTLKALLAHLLSLLLVF